MKPAAVALLALSLLAACSRRHRAETAAESENPLPQACLGCLDTLAQSSPDLRLSDVEMLDIDSRGDVYFDAGGSIFVLDSTLGYRRRIGRHGAGPGEFGGSLTLQLLPGDTLLACDVNRARITLFAPGSDRVVRTVHLGTARGGLPNTVTAMDGTRRYLARFEQPFQAGRPQASDSVRVIVIGTLDSLGSVVSDSILALPGGQPLVARSAQAVMVHNMPFGREAMTQVAGGRLYFTETDEPVLHVVPLDGSPHSDVRFPYAAAGLSAEAIAHATKQLGAEPLMAEFRRHPPEHWPVLRELVVSPEGDAWVEVLTQPEETVAWIRIDSQGHVKERIDMPWNVRLKAVHGDRFYAVETDDDDVPRVMLLRRRRSASGSGGTSSRLE